MGTKPTNESRLKHFIPKKKKEKIETNSIYLHIHSSSRSKSMEEKFTSVSRHALAKHINQTRCDARARKIYPDVYLCKNFLKVSLFSFVLFFSGFGKIIYNESKKQQTKKEEKERKKKFLPRLLR